MVVAASCTSGMWRNVRLCVPCASQELPDGTGHVGRLQSTRRVPRVQAGLSSAASLPPLCRCIGGRVVQAAACSAARRVTWQRASPLCHCQCQLVWYGRLSGLHPSTVNRQPVHGRWRWRHGISNHQWIRRGAGGTFLSSTRQQQTQKQLPYKA
jgi:hypothetical protein